MARPGKGKARVTKTAQAPTINETIYAERAAPGIVSPTSSAPAAVKPQHPNRTALLAALLLAGLALVAFPIGGPTPTGQIAGLSAAPTLAVREQPKSEITGTVTKPREATRRRYRRSAEPKADDPAAWLKNLFAPPPHQTSRAATR
jgi:hypothetical protein